MIGIIKKDFWLFMTGPCIVLPILILVEYFLNISTRPAVIVNNNILFFLFICAPVMLVEQNEEKNDAYRFMSMLPLRKSEIVGAKFIFVFIITTIMILINYLSVNFIFNGMVQLQIIKSIFIVVGMSAMLFAGVFYLGIYKMGYTRFLAFLGFIAVVLGLIPPIVIVIGKGLSEKKLDIVLPLIVDFLKDLNHGTWILVCTIIYILLMILAIWLFTFESKNKRVYFLDL